MERKYLLVTGASSGMGREIAVRLSGIYNIVLCGRDLQRLEQTVEMCDKNGRHLIFQADLARVESIEESLGQFITQNGCFITAFVHSAGYMKTIPLKMITPELFQNSFNVNVTAAAIIAKVLTKKKVNEGALKNIVIISSNISSFGAKAFSAYASSKAAADGLMRCLAVELAPKVRVNSVLPGGVRTAMTEHMYQDQALIERMEASYPLGLGTTKDICGVVEFLLSDSARWITGQQITVDGGRTIDITG